MHKIKFIYFAILIFSILYACSANVSSETNTSKKQTQFNNDTTEISKALISYTDEDKQIFDSLLHFVRPRINKNTPISAIELMIANFFINTPYAAHTLENDNAEHLVVNLRGVDCTTFLENVVCLALCIKNNKILFNDYTNQLTRIRYNDGIIDGYPSRLHYFSDWIVNNRKKGLINLVSNDFGNKNFDPGVSFMSTHPQYYKQLSNKSFVKQISEREKLISKYDLKYITKDYIPQIESNVNDGDLIAISTSHDGLDISHVGIAKHHNNRLHFVHASSSKKKVVLSKKPLSDYLAKIKSNTGILVCRLTGKM